MKQITNALSLCAALFAASLAAPQARALDITGLIKVNGNEMPDVLIGVYDCTDGTLLGATHTGATDSSSGTPLNYAISVPSDNVRLELYYHPTPELVPIADWCRDFVLCGQIVPVDGKATVNVNMTCVFSGVDGPEYWKTHPSDWPVDVITIGGRTLTKLQAISLMSVPDRNDKTRTAFRNLVAAKLNVLIGNDDSCISEAIEATDAWLARYPVGSGVKATSAVWKRISETVARLEAYNSGLLCAPLRVHDGI